MSGYQKLGLLLAVIVGLLVGGGLFTKDETVSPLVEVTEPLEKIESGAPSGVVREGERLAKAVCVGCHEFVPPERYDKRTWAFDVLPVMELLMGAVSDPYDQLEGEPILKEQGFIPDPPIVNRREKNAITAYYLAKAPVALPDLRPHSIQMEESLAGFEMLPTERFGRASTTMLEIDEENRSIFLGRSSSHGLILYNPEGRRLFSHRLESAPVRLIRRDERYYMGMFENLDGTDHPEGKLGFVSAFGQPVKEAGILVENLPRVSWMDAGDFDGDGQEEFVVCAVGQWLGRLSIFDQDESGNWKERVLLNRPGAVRTEFVDIDADGHKDLVALFMHAQESVLMFDGAPDADWEMSPLQEFTPDFGGTHFEVADFNGDGLPDFAVSNGYSGEFAKFPRMADHEQGIRLFLNQGDRNFEAGGFLEARGVTQFNFRDYDKDGDLDVAAVAYYARRNLEDPGFIYWENEGGVWKARSMEDEAVGHWLVMDSGDVDGDGDLDIVIGSNTSGPGDFPPEANRYWMTEGPEFIILRNELISPK